MPVSAGGMAAERALSEVLSGKPCSIFGPVDVTIVEFKTGAGTPKVMLEKSF